MAEEKSIGKLTIDISDVSKKIDEVNSFLRKIGADINIEDKLSKGIKTALNRIVDEAKKAAEEAQKATQSAVKMDASGGLESTMSKVTSTVKTYVSEVSAAGDATAKLVSSVQSGFDSAGNKIKEYADSSGSITRRTEEIKNSVDEQIEAMWKLHDAEEQAYQKQGEAAVEAGLKREEAARKATQAEQERTAKEVAAMEEDALKQEALLDRQITKYEEAEQKKVQASIDAEFKREEARKKAIEAAEKERELWQSEVAMMDEATQKQAEAFNKQFDESQIARAKQAYFDLTDAIKNYNAAKKEGDTSGMEQYQQQISKQMEVVAQIEEAARANEMEAASKQQVLNLTQQCKTAEHDHAASIQQSVSATGELESQMTSLMTRMFSLVAVIRTINSLIQNTVEYVSAYYDKMNEIQIITQKSSDEIKDLGETYMTIAEQMSVSSLDIADAAIYFTRQGLQAEEIETRLKNVTMYAKTASVEFKEASEIITAVVNSMGLMEQQAEDGRNATQRVADVFLKVGDSAATSGEEIGRAMQKAAASAGAFGMSFEWLASYIATVSETTRQEARTIGTAFNTIIARLHQIKQTGYNSEDETKLNDVQKALNNINVSLMDQNLEWRDMDTIFQEIGSKWGDLDDKTKSYIATTMAGVKQQNVFLALMNDLGKQAEGNSRAWELYAKAMDSAGTAEKKYATWTDSVAASQERLNLAQEKFYSLLDANVIKDWNNMLAGYVNMIVDGADALGNWTIILPVVIGLVAAVAVGIHGMNLKLKETITLTAMLEKHPIMIAIAAGAAVIAALVTAFSALGSAIESTEEKLAKANTVISESSSQIQSLTALKNNTAEMFENIDDSSGSATKSLKDYEDVLGELSKISPEAKSVVDDLKNGFIRQKEAAEKLNEELQKQLELQNKIQMQGLRDKYAASSNTDTRSLLYRDASTWDASTFESLDAFTRHIRQYADPKNGIWGTSHLKDYWGEDVANMIKNTLKTYESIAEDDRWQIVGQKMWETFFSGGDIRSLSDIMNADINAMIEAVIPNLTFGKDETTSRMIREQLAETLFGTDNEADYDEWSNASIRLSKFINDMIYNAIELTSKDKVLFNIKDIWGRNSSISEGIIESIEGLLQSDPEYADRVAGAFEELFAAGISNANIGKVLYSLPVEQWGDAVEVMKNKLLNVISQKTNAALHDYGEGGSVDMLMWTKLDVATLNWIYNLIDAGTELEKIKEIMRSSESVDEFKNKLSQLGAVTEENVTEGAEEATESIDKLIKEIDNLNKIIDSISKGDSVDFDDLLNLSEAHPEIMAVINDTEKLLAVLQQVRNTDMSKTIDVLRSNLMNNADFAKQSGFAVDEGQTLQEFVDKYKGGAELVKQYVDQIIVAFLAQSGKLESVGKDILGNWMESMFSDSNVDLLNRPILDFGDHIETLVSEAVTASKDGKEGLQWNEDIIMHFTPITPDGRKLDSAELNNYVEELLAKSANVEELKANDKLGLNLLIGISEKAGDESWEEAINNANTLDQLLHLLQEAYYGVIEANETWLDLQVKQQEINERNEWAKSNGFIDQIKELTSALGEGGEEGVYAAMDVWNGYNDAMKKSIADTYPSLIEALHEAEGAINDTEKSEEKFAKATDSMNAALNKSAKYASVKHFKNTYDAIQKLEKGTISVSKAYEAFNKDLESVEKAADDVADVTEKLGEGVTEIGENSKVTSSDVKNLAALLEKTPQQVLDDWPAAVAEFEELIGFAGSLEQAIADLNKEAFIRITGIGIADFSQITNGLALVDAEAEEAAKKLAATGQWVVEPIELNGETDVLVSDGSGGLAIERRTLQGTMDVLKPAQNNPLGNTGSSTKKKSGGGGGGGGKKETNANDESFNKWLDKLEKARKVSQYMKDYWAAIAAYYKSMGLYQGSIEATENQIKAIEKENRTLNKNVNSIQKKIKEKEKELKQYKKGSEEYKKTKEQIEKLNDTMKDYKTTIVENKTAIVGLQDAIKDMRNELRDMQIDLANEVYKAIEDRENKKKNMLKSEIDLQNKILEIIQKRYEVERDEIINATQLKIDALKEERDLLSEQLELRKKQAEQEDKQQKLRELELQYQRIAADPTRAKEAEKIRKQIADLREEMAWDAAEEEVKAQQDSIDQQITSLEDYIDYINKYYEELFENPQQLIAEMEQIMKKSEDQILKWLKDNDEEYKNSTAARKKQMTEEWQDTLDERAGRIRTYWAEVESILKKGDTAIVQFLKDNSDEYAKAGKLQAEKYEKEWIDRINNIKKGLQEVTDIEKKATSVSSSKSTSSNKNNSSSNKNNSSGSSKLITTLSTAVNNAKNLPKYTNITAYDKGGVASYTGPAWLDGTQTDPERVLSPYQTKLFESMIVALDKMSRISVPTMPDFGDVNMTGGGSTSVGDIIVNVDNLDTDDDYETLAKKVSDILMERIGRTTVVGGLRINP